jgi:hypothetical protein
MSSIDEKSAELLKPLETDPDHYLRLAYATSYAKWLHRNKLSKTEVTWLAFKTCHYGRGKFASQT